MQRLKITLILFISIFIFFKIKLVRDELLSLRQEEEHLQQTVSHEPLPIVKPMKEIDVMNDLMRCVNNSGWQLDELSPKKCERDCLSFEMLLSGDKINLNSLLTRLTQIPWLLDIENMSMHDEKLKMNIVIYHLKHPDKKIFEWIGYIQQRDHLIALLKMPNGEVMEAKSGTWIDHVFLKKINTQQMWLQSGNKEWSLEYY